MTFQKEILYRRAVKELARSARRDGGAFRPPEFSLSELRGNIFILRDEAGLVAALRMTHRGGLRIL